MNNGLAIKTCELTKQYGRISVVDRLSLRVPKQQITAFLGRNGAGKSTTIKMLLGIASPSSGTGSVLGKMIRDASQNRELRREVAYVAEDKQLYSYMTVGQLIRFTRSFYSDWRTDTETRLLKQFQLPLSQKVKALSKGMRTKLALLLALSRQPQLLIMDEPSEGLDPVSVEELLHEIVGAAASGVTVFFSSHQIAEVERIADRACIIDHGKLLVDTSLEDMRRDYRRITLSFDADPPAVGLFLPGIQQVRTNGRQMTLLAKENVDAVVELTRDMHPASIEVSPVGLREVFLETVKEER
ncbi:MAG: ABC transporter ATP-binding protein [Candidatus Acidiferrum sp.]